MPKLNQRQLLMLCGGLVTVWVAARWLADQTKNKGAQGIAVGEPNPQWRGEYGGGFAR